MKILQSCLSPSWGGLEISALRTTIQLKARGHELGLLCSENSTLSDEALKNGIEVFSLKPGNISGVAEVLKLKKILVLEKFGVLHTHLSHDLWLLVPALRLAQSDAKLFLTRHMGSGVKKKDVLHRMLYNRVNQILAISNYVKQSVLDTCPVDKDKVTVLHPAIEPANYVPAKYNKAQIKERLSINREKIVIGMASRFSPGKGHEEFLAAAKILADEFGDKLHFLVAGDASFGEENYSLKILKTATDLGLDKNIKFTGHYGNVSEILSAMDIFVLPSHEESFGVLLVEAMAMELPTVASNNAGIPDIVEDEQTGILVPPKNALELASALKRLALSSELRTRLGNAGRKRAEGIFNSVDELDKLEKFYAA